MNHPRRVDQQGMIAIVCALVLAGGCGGAGLAGPARRGSVVAETLATTRRGRIHQDDGAMQSP
jgi:hypothetical protein